VVKNKTVVHLSIYRYRLHQLLVINMHNVHIDINILYNIIIIYRSEDLT